MVNIWGHSFNQYVAGWSPKIQLFFMSGQEGQVQECGCSASLLCKDMYIYWKANSGLDIYEMQWPAFTLSNCAKRVLT